MSVYKMLNEARLSRRNTIPSSLTTFAIQSAFLNDLFDPDVVEEQLDILLAFKRDNIPCELIWQDQKQYGEKIKSIFKYKS
jgi:hypothetical protein